MKAILTLCLLMLTLFACKESSQDSISLSLLVKGTTTQSPVVAQNGTLIYLERADLAFGPLYLCAGVNAGDLCDVARLEWLDSAVVNTLNEQAQPVGELHGATGQVLSWMYDLGISSQLTRDDPFILKAAEELNGHSVEIEGRAVIDDIEVPFSASLSLKQNNDTELGVTIIRKSLSDRFDKEVTLKDRSLTIQFNPADWVRNLDLSPYVGREECSPESPSLICNGTREFSCIDGQLNTERNCSDLNQICVPKQGCVDSLVVEHGSEPYRSIRNAIFSGVRPTFTWNEN